MRKSCTHLNEVNDVPAPGHVCEDCVKIGDDWVHLRQCLVCGHVACCDNSRNKHATAHFHHTAHPVMRSAEPGEAWRWCYVDQEMV